MTEKFAKRSQEIELMDDLQSSGKVIDQTLKELDTINKLLGGNHVTTNGLNKLIDQCAEMPEKLVIIDIGCGGGDMLKLIAHWAKNKGLNIELIGVDANPNIIEFARKNTLAYPEISYKSINIFSPEFSTLKCDIITATLFTHHFTDIQLMDLFCHCQKQARIGMVINDLHRHWFAYHSIKLLTTAFSKSEMVKNDAAVSVLRSFHKDEIKDILKNCNINNYSLKWMWAFRWQIVANFG